MMAHQEIAGAMREALAAWDQADRREMRASTEAERSAAAGRLAWWRARAETLEDWALGTPPTTLAEAVVVAGVLFDRLARTADFDLESQVKSKVLESEFAVFERVAAGLVLCLMRCAGVDWSAMHDPDLRGRIEGRGVPVAAADG